jgi:hypothetical protein
VNGSQPTAAVSLAVAKGLYSVLLGDTALTNMTAIPAGVFTNADVRLRVWFNDGTNGFQQLTPDQRLAAAGYAMVAASVTDGAITSSKLAPNAVSSASIAAGAVNGAHLANSSVDLTRLAVGGTAVDGYVLGYNGTGLGWIPPGGGGVFSLNGSNAYYNGGRVGIGTSSPAASLEVNGTNGNTLLYATAPRPTLILRDTIASNARSVIGGFAGGTRFYTESFWSSSNPLAFMALDNSGFLGIGTAAPQSALHISGTANAVRLTGAKPYLTFDDTSAGLYSRIEADGAGINLKTQGAVTGSNPGGLIHLDGTGTVGIGTTQPGSQLSIIAFPGVPTWTSNGWLGAIELSNASAIGWRTNTAGQRFGMGHTNGGFSLFRTASDPGTGASPAIYDFFVSDAGNVGIGTTFPAAKLHVIGTVRTSVLTITGGADLAEPFAMSHGGIAPGTVVSIDPEQPGKLQRSAAAYDRKVAGIVSGANGIKPGISMIDEQQLEPGENVALSGRVYVKANASGGPIEPGDLLTTSGVPGEAMRAADHVRAQGAILGKAMTRLEAGSGKVLVLVTLQ